MLTDAILSIPAENGQRAAALRAYVLEEPELFKAAGWGLGPLPDKLRQQLSPGTAASLEGSFSPPCARISPRTPLQ